jgi:RHS repeat-associated protein
VTDASGEVFQHLEYFAFGETFVEEHSNTNRTPYLFNGKELDEETNLYYYGDRFYDPKTSIWLGVDKATEKYPGLSPFVYCANNPVVYFDPNGRDIILFFYSQKTSETGAGHVAIAVGQSNDDLTYFSHYPTKENKPGGGHIVKNINYDKAKGYDKGKGLQSVEPALVIRIKTSGDVDKQAIAQLTEQVQKEWFIVGRNCASDGKTACDAAGLDYLDGEAISSPSTLAWSILNKNDEKMKDGTITVEEGDSEKFLEENDQTAAASVVGTAIKKGWNATGKAISGFFKNVGDFWGDVKYKTVQGINSVNNLGGN